MRQADHRVGDHLRDRRDVSVAMFFVTNQRRYPAWATLLLKLVIVAGLLFFAVLLLNKIF